MGTSLIESRKNGASPKRLTDQQRMFVLELLADDNYSPTEAARRAGYKNPPQAANKLLKNKAVAAILGKAKREREERSKLTSDDVWRYLHSVLSFNPFKMWERCSDEWVVRDPETIPDEIACLIEEVEEQTIEQNGQRITRFKVKPVSKSRALEIAARHALPQEHQLKAAVTTFPPDFFDMLCQPSEDIDVIEQRISGTGSTNA